LAWVKFCVLREDIGNVRTSLFLYAGQ